MFGTYRFVLALNVVIFHILSVPIIGPLAVYSFFILSGYLMTFIMNKTYGYSVLGIKKYGLNRFYRLYPIYWVCLLFSFAIILVTGSEFSEAFNQSMSLPDGIGSSLANILMLYPGWHPNEYPIRMSPATWALTIEIVFYFLIGLGLSKNKLITWVWFLFSLCFFLHRNLILQEFTFGYGNFISASLPFSAGALIYWYKEQINSVLHKLHLNVSITLLFFTVNILIVAFSGFASDNVSWKIEYMCTGINLLLSVILTCQLADYRSHNLRFRALDKELGDLSYPIYVFHWAAAVLAAWLIYQSPTKDIPVFALGLIIALIFSYVINITINKRIERLRMRVKG